jgi:(p)ppGpp synthase/HD superfamily hydrolase
MKPISTIIRALEKAAVLHDGQYRKNSKIPYIIHPVAVMCEVASYTASEDALVAALLHDTLEDTTYTVVELEKDFGLRVKQLVLDVTEDKLLPWRERKERYLEHLRTVAHADSVIISACDKLHNMRSMIDQFGTRLEKGTEEWKAFEGKPEGYLWYWGEMLHIIENRTNEKLAQEFREVYNRTRVVLGGQQ